jgi:hypothetical protein
MSNFVGKRSKAYGIDNLSPSSLEYLEMTGTPYTRGLKISDLLSS